MRITVFLTCFVLGLVAGPVLAECEGPSDVLSACGQIDAADSQLNAAYRDILAVLDHPTPEMAIHHAKAKESLIAAQQAWQKFRDLDCDAVFDIADGTSEVELSGSCVAERDLQRAKELREMALGL